MPDKLLIIDEAADALRVSPETIRRYLRSHALRGVKIGGQWRIHEADLSHFVSSEQSNGHQPDAR
jgi:excisionase family DNA binding protein